MDIDLLLDRGLMPNVDIVVVVELTAQCEVANADAVVGGELAQRLDRDADDLRGDLPELVTDADPAFRPELVLQPRSDLIANFSEA